MSSASNYCPRCRLRGHNIHNCPHNQEQVEVHTQTRPHHQRSRAHGEGNAQMFMNTDTDAYLLPPPPTPLPPPTPTQMFMNPYMKSQIQPHQKPPFTAQGSELFPIQRVDSLQDNTDISLLPDFWHIFGIDDTLKLAQFVLSTAKLNERARPELDRRTFPLVTELFKNQETPQQSTDMFICFTAVGVLSKLMERKCKIVLKGKTGLFLCADILGKSGDLAGVTTDDIDLLILAKQFGTLDQSRKIFAQQVGAFITLCLRDNQKNAESVKRGEASPIHKCADVIIRGDGICGTSLESKNVKVTLDVGDGVKLKLVDITYTTYHKDIDRFYSRFSMVDVSREECYFYLDVKVSIMEYVFIILENVRKCSDHVKKTGSPASKLEEFMPRSTKEKEQKLRSQQLLVERRGVPQASSRFPAAVDFMDNLTDFEQSTMFKFSKSALLCASLIAESPEYESEGLDQEEKWVLQKRIVVMQLYELSRYGIIPRKFTRLIAQTQDVLEEMLSDVILQKREVDRFKDAKMHKHTADRLKAIEVLNSSRPTTSFETHRYRRVTMGVAAEDFDIRQMVDNPLFTPRELPHSEEDETDIDIEAGEAADAEAYAKKNRTRKNKHRLHKTAVKLVLQKRGALEARRQHRDEDESLPRLIELRSDSSSVNSGDYFSPRSSISTNDSAQTMYTPSEGSPHGGGSGRRRRKSRKRVCRKRYTRTKTKTKNRNRK